MLQAQHISRSTRHVWPHWTLGQFPSHLNWTLMRQTLPLRQSGPGCGWTWTLTPAPAPASALAA